MLLVEGYFFKKFDSPRAKGIEPFKQIQIHLKSVQTRKHSQGLREDGGGCELPMHRTELTTQSRAVGPQKDRSALFKENPTGLCESGLL